MACLAVLLVSLIPLAVAQFVPPRVILQAGYPSGFRAFIPDFPGCQQFAFHGKINRPFTEENELGSIFQETLRPQNGFWIVQDYKLILTPGDIIHYWTNVVKDGVGYPKRNQTWKVPGPEGSVDILKPPKQTPEKVKETEPTPTVQVTTPGTETAPTSTEETTSSDPETSVPSSTTTTETSVTTAEITDSTTKSTPTTVQSTSSTTTSQTKTTTLTSQTTPPITTTQKPTTTLTSQTTSPITTSQTTPTTLMSQTTPSTITPQTTLSTVTSQTTKSTPTTVATTTAEVTTTATKTKKSPTTEKPETPNPNSLTDNSPLEEEVEELTTPFSRERPLFPEDSPLFPFPGLYPRPFKPMMPSNGPGFEICSNPWNFEERIGETRTQKLERQVAKLQCQLALFQRGYNQLSNTVETEMTDLKKLMYGMVSRMASLESVLRSTPFG